MTRTCCDSFSIQAWDCIKNKLRSGGLGQAASKVATRDARSRIISAYGTQVANRARGAIGICNRTLRTFLVALVALM